MRLYKMFTLPCQGILGYLTLSMGSDRQFRCKQGRLLRGYLKLVFRLDPLGQSEITTVLLN